MKNILIVDDEPTLLRILTMQSKSDEYKDQFNLYTARNGKEALRVLESTVIDFVATDLRMPEMDGIELLAHMSTKFPSVPAIAMSAFSTPEIEQHLKKMGTLRVLDKPVDFQTLAGTIEDLARSHEDGALKGISVGGFIQLIQMEEKTCLLEVQGEKNWRGFLYFKRGDLVDASCGDCQGERAALEMIGWDNVKLFLRDLSKKNLEKRIDKGIMFLIMEGLRLKDEAGKAEKSESPKSPSVAEIQDESLMDELQGLLDELHQDSETASPEEGRKDQESKRTEGTTPVESVGKILGIINSKLRGSELFQAVFREIHSIVPFDLAMIMTRERSRPGFLKVLDLMATGITTIAKSASYPHQDSIMATALKQQTTLIVDDTGPLSHPVEKELFANHGSQACLLAPLVTEGIATGLLVLTAKNPGILYDVQRAMEWIANGISQAVERDSLSAELVKSKQALDASKWIGRVLTSWTFDINRVLRYSMQMIQKVINVEAGFLLLKVKNELQVATAFNVSAESMKKLRPKIGQGIAGHVAARGESIIVNDTQKSSHFSSGVDKGTGLKTRSALCVPMVVQGKVIGVIEVINKVKGDFDAGDEDLLQSVADSVGIAIKSAHLYRKAVSGAKHDPDERDKSEKRVLKEVQGYGMNSPLEDLALIYRKDQTPLA